MVIEIARADRATIERNYKRHPKGWDGALRCQVCSAPIIDKPGVLWMHVHCGGGWAVTEEEAATLPECEDLGAQPIGPDCLRQHPELRPYVVKGA